MINGWSQCQRLMTVHFGDSEVYHAKRYERRNSIGDPLIECQTLWESRTKDEWFHAFVHTLDRMLRSWYILAKLHREFTTWEHLIVFFTHSFIFADANLDVHNVLQLIRNVVLKVVSISYRVDPHVHCGMQSMMECYNL